MLLGFHGTSTRFRNSLLAGIDPDRVTRGARGRGFYLCSSGGEGSLAHLFSEIRARQTGERPLILGVFLDDAREDFKWLTHYDWGKMDIDDKVEETGLEMVVYPDACGLIRCQQVEVNREPNFPWDHCPKSRVTEYIGKGIRAVTPPCLQWDPTVGDRLQWGEMFW